MPSRVDNYPNACLEAQSMGISVIGSDNSSLSEMITDGETGFIFGNGNALELQNAIERLLRQTPEQRARMREQILVQIDHILEESCITQLINFYEVVCKSFNPMPSGWN
ncbi:MAG: hypothetical protein NVS2B14_04910 [Chamaesiphon sp.]